MNKVKIIRISVNPIGFNEVITKISEWGRLKKSSIVCLCNVHMLMTANKDEELAGILNTANLVLPDGAPIAWCIKKSGFTQQERLSGPDLMWRYLAVAEKLHQTVFFYGSSPQVLNLLKLALSKKFPLLSIGGMISPPYGEVTDEESSYYVDIINKSNAEVVFVGLGCPKQEKWMFNNKDKINAVMIGVGAAFDYHSGVLKRAPSWAQNNGFEWLFRFLYEPRRLWRRYLVTNTSFLIKITLNFLKYGGGVYKD